MSDLYTELLVKRKTQLRDKVLKVVLIVVTILAAFVGLFMTPLGFIALIAMGVADYILLPRFDLEFEYLYVNGELDIDKIMSKQKRKRAASYDMEKMEMIAPWNSHELDYHKNDTKAKISDYSSKTENANVYGMIYNSDKGKEIVLLELNNVVLNDIRRIAPRKIKLG